MSPRARTKKEKRARIEMEDVRHLADLAHLTLSTKEEEEIRVDLSEILDYFAVVDKARTEGLKPTWQTVGGAALREDVPVTFEASKIDKVVPRRSGRLVRAPRVF